MTQRELHDFLMALEALLCNQNQSPKDLLKSHRKIWKRFKKSKCFTKLDKQEQLLLKNYALTMEMFLMAVDRV